MHLLYLSYLDSCLISSNQLISLLFYGTLGMESMVSSFFTYFEENDSIQFSNNEINNWFLKQIISVQAAHSPINIAVSLRIVSKGNKIEKWPLYCYVLMEVLT